MITLILFAIFLLILILPITVKRVEHNLELFLHVVGTVTLLFSHWLGPEQLINLKLMESAFLEPSGEGHHHGPYHLRRDAHTR